jgi:hypothetical protein
MYGDDIYFTVLSSVVYSRSVWKSIARNETV